MSAVVNIRPVFNGDAIPEDLKRMKRWSPWRERKNKTPGGKPIKVPDSSTNEPDTWSTFPEALARMGPGAAGLGYLMTGEHGIIGLDLDNCVQDGKPNAFAQEIIEQADTYTEVSPSGNGLRLFLRGSAAANFTRKDGDVGIELYSGLGSRYLTVTGAHLDGTPMALGTAPALIDRLLARYASSAPSTSAQPLPDLVDVPPMLELAIPKADLDFLTTGEGRSDDGSLNVFSAACSLCKIHDDATVLSILFDSHARDVAERHWQRADPMAQTEASLDYLWRHHVLKARAAVGPLEPDNLFDDLSEDAPPEAAPAPAAGFEPNEFTHEQVLPTGVVLIAGGHGGGKTSLLVPLASMASGEINGAAHGLPSDLQRVVIYFTEDPAQARRIRYGLVKHCGLKENGNFHIHQSRRLDAVALKARIAKIVARYTIEGPNGYRVKPLIVFDTINACFEIENENDASQVGQIMAAIKGSSEGAPVWLVGHLPKTLLHKDVAELTARGSGAWEADAQCTAFIVADEDPESNVRYLVTRKRRFETDITEIRFETHIDREVVATPWGTQQVMAYRYGVPERATVSRKEAKEQRKEDGKTKAFLQDVEIMVDFIADRIQREGAVWMRRAGGSPKAPAGAEGFTLTWDELYASTGVTRGMAPGPKQEAVRERFEPFTGWGRMVLREDGALW